MILVVESTYDPITRLISTLRLHEFQQTLQYVNSQMIILEGHEVNRILFSEYCSSPDVLYITGLGHGNYDTFTGHLGIVLWKVGKFLDTEVEGKIIHLLSCRCGKELGHYIINRGGKAFFGYTENFQVYTNANASSPFVDEYIQPFVRCDSLVDQGVLQYLSVREIYRNVYNAYSEEIYYWASIDPEIAKALLWDREFFCALGKPDSSLISGIFDE